MQIRCRTVPTIRTMVLCGWLAVGAQAHGAQLQSTTPQTPPAASQGSPAPQAQGNAAPSSSSGGAAPALSLAAARRSAWACLSEGLAEKNYDRRAQAITALATIGAQAEAVRVVETGLDDKNDTVRLAAAKALGTMKAHSSIPRLQVALDDHSAGVGFAAAQSLWAMGDRSGEDIFLDVVEGDRKVSSGMIHEGLQKAHEEMHDPAALAQLGAEQAAGTFFGPAGFGVDVAVEMMKDKAAPARAVSARMLGDDTNPDSRAVLGDALGDRSWIVRAAAAEALGVRGTASDVALLVPLLSDPQKQVRYRAAASIIRVTSRRTK